MGLPAAPRQEGWAQIRAAMHRAPETLLTDTSMGALLLCDSYQHRGGFSYLGFLLSAEESQEPEAKLSAEVEPV